MPEEIEVDTDKLREAIADEVERESGGLLRTIALSTALFAAFAAITSLQAGSTANEALILKTEATVLQAKASDAWAYYQAKGIKAAIAHNAQGTWAAAGKSPPVSLGEDEARYLKEQHDLDKRARDLEHERDVKSAEADHLMHQHHRFAESVALLQVGIALGAVAALTRKRAAWWASIALGLVGCALFVYAFVSAR
ncbi:DUF4337 domain-containing protein [Dyella sp. Tek66A03]|uniref:DUF4337 domain-containing protein n=1 Tax=Dyella sp. Tek66A03 TaxID=3458298 RepID=UPI0031B95A0E